MRPWWDLFPFAAALVVLSACGESSREGGRGGSRADGGTGAVTTGGASGASGATAGNAGSGVNGGSGGSPGGSGGASTLACHDRTTNHTPGTRLRPRYAVTSEGDRAWTGWHDTELDIDCRFSKAPDGTMRCFPNGYPVYATYGFADANCSDELVAVQSCGTFTYVSKTEGSSGCAAGTTRVFQMGAMTALSTIYVGTPGACNPYPADANATFYHYGAQVDPTTLVEGTDGSLPSSGRIRTEGVTATDGAMSVGGWFDTELQVPCSFGSIETGSLHCIPSRGYATGFSDASCATEVLRTACTTGADPPKSYAVLPSTNICLSGRLVSVGAPTAGPVYWPDGDKCYLPLDAMQTGFQIGPDAPASVLPKVTPTVLEADPGRLKPVYLEADDGGCWFEDWYDSELEARCEFELFGDGLYRCVPTPDHRASVFMAYSDAGCTVEAPVGTVGPCSRTTPKVAIATGGDACGLTANVWSAGDVVSPASLPPLFTKSGDTCSPAVLPDTNVYVSLGPKRDQSALMSGELRVE